MTTASSRKPEAPCMNCQCVTERCPICLVCLRHVTRDVHIADCPHAYCDVERLKWYSDPAHGWLRVPASAFPDFNIEESCTGCGYERTESGERVFYLEEDMEATHFMLMHPETDDMRYHEVWTSGEALCRRYRRNPARLTSEAFRKCLADNEERVAKWRAERGQNG